jgi:class 3 adenylate cyclase
VREEFVCGTAEETGDVPCAITVLGLARGRTKEITAYVVQILDLRKLQEQQAAAVAAKARAEELLYAILPRQIVRRLESGEREIAYSVASATVAFLDVHQFSSFALSLTPAETVRSLAQVFAGYDAALVKYELCVKVKFIGDSYMLAAGLFETEVEPSRHAAEAVHFCFDCLQSVEDTNQQLNINLGVRVGVHTGGPVLAGVLGADRPVFDIVGEPIHVAAGLQAAGAPGEVQVSEETLAQVQHLDFSVGPRRTVTLKGKEERPAYFLTRPAGKLAGVKSVGSLGDLLGPGGARAAHGSRLAPTGSAKGSLTLSAEDLVVPGPGQTG